MERLDRGPPQPAADCGPRLAVLLRQAYPQRRLRSGAALQVTARLPRIPQPAASGDRGEVQPRRSGAPRPPGRHPPPVAGFVEAYRLEANLQVNEFDSTPRPCLPGPRPRPSGSGPEPGAGRPELRYTRAYAAIPGGRLAEAETLLATFEAEAPGDVRVLGP